MKFNPLNAFARCPEKQLSLVYVSLSGMLYGSMCLLGILLMQRGFPVFTMLFWRFALAAVFIALVARKHLRLKALKHSFASRKNVASLLLGAVLYGASSCLLFIASQSIGTGLSMVVFYSFPIFVFLWMFLARREPVSFASWLCLLVVCAGFPFLNQDAQIPNFDSIGIFWALIAAACYAFYILFSEKQANDLDPWLASFILCVVNAIYFLILCVVKGEFLVPFDLDTWVIAFALGVFATALPIVYLLIGLKSMRADLASILSVLEPVVTLLLGSLFLAEDLSGAQIFGIIVILAGAIGTTLSMNEKKPAPEASMIAD